MQTVKSSLILILRFDIKSIKSSKYHLRDLGQRFFFGLSHSSAERLGRKILKSRFNHNNLGLRRNVPKPFFIKLTFLQL